MNLVVCFYVDVVNVCIKLENGFELINYDEWILEFVCEYFDKFLVIDVNIDMDKMLDMAW